MLGHSTLIGARTGKVLSYTLRCKSCRVCENAKRRKKKPGRNQCSRNWSGVYSCLIFIFNYNTYQLTRKRSSNCLSLLTFYHCNPMTFVAWVAILRCLITYHLPLKALPKLPSLEGLPYLILLLSFLQGLQDTVGHFMELFLQWAIYSSN